LYFPLFAPEWHLSYLPSPACRSICRPTSFASVCPVPFRLAMHFSRYPIALLFGDRGSQLDVSILGSFDQVARGATWFSRFLAFVFCDSLFLRRFSPCILPLASFFRDYLFWSLFPLISFEPEEAQCPILLLAHSVILPLELRAGRLSPRQPRASLIAKVR